MAPPQPSDSQAASHRVSVGAARRARKAKARAAHEASGEGQQAADQDTSHPRSARAKRLERAERLAARTLMDMVGGEYPSWMKKRPAGNQPSHMAKAKPQTVHWPALVEACPPTEATWGPTSGQTKGAGLPPFLHGCPGVLQSKWKWNRHSNGMAARVRPGAGARAGRGIRAGRPGDLSSRRTQKK